MKITYYGVDAATKSIWFFGVDGDVYTGKFDADTGEWQLDPYSQDLPTTVFVNSYRILDSTDDKVLYEFEGKRYEANSNFTKFGPVSYIWSVNNVVETNLTSFAEDKLAQATANPLVPILLIAAAYWVFIR